MGKKGQEWIKISGCVFIAQKELTDKSDEREISLEQSRREHLEALLSVGVPLEMIEYAVMQYNSAYSINATIRNRFNRMKQELSEDQIRGLERNAPGTDWECYWTGEKLVWRLESSRDQATLRYHRRTHTA